MTGIPPEDWRSVADLPNTSYPDAIAEYIEKMMTDVAVAESKDIRAALEAWPDIEAEHLMRIKYHADGPQVRVDRDYSVFTRPSPPKMVVEVPRLIVVADLRHTGTANPDGHLLPVDWRRHERTYVGERYTVALLHRDEAAKIPVHTGTEVADYAPNMED